MKRIFSLQAFFCLIAYANAVHAQPTGKITGQVVNNEKKPLASATVSLLRAKSSALVKVFITTTEGKFEFEFENLKADTFILSITHVGFIKYTSDPVVISQANQQVALSVIQLRPGDAAILKEITVKANKPFVEQLIDRTVVNVDAFISNTGANALEVLEKSPGVIVDENGKISLKGKSGVLILIDDKPTYLSGVNLATYLRSLPSSSLDKIELMSNPPAKYDAEAGAGVINIKTKKLKAKGFNGNLSASVGQAVYERTNESLNLNYRSGKINVFGNLAYSTQHSWRQLEIERRYFTPNGDLESVFAQTSLFRPERRSPNLKAGLDYYLSPKTTVGIVFTGSYSRSTDRSPVKSYIYNDNSKLDSLIDADNAARDKFSSTGVNLNFKHQFDSTGRELTFDLDYIKYTSTSRQSFLNSTYDSAGAFKYAENLSDDLPSDIGIYAAKTDYERPLGAGAKIEAGLKTSYVWADNSANYFYIMGNTTTVDNDKTNRFKYHENINAAYISFTREYNRFTVKAGLRLENTNRNGHQLGNAVKPDSFFTKSYTNLFPTTYISYRLDSSGKNSLLLSYGRRIRRPYYQDLNPFIFLVDKFSYFSGNPFEKSQFSDNIEMSWHYKGLFTTSLFYNYITDLQQETIEQSRNIFISRPGNIGKRIKMGISVNLSLKPVKGWSSNIYTELINTSDKGSIATTSLHINTTYWLVNTNNQFMFKKGWSAELSGFYLTNSTDAQFVKSSLWQLNAGIQKKIFYDKGSVRCSVRDIFHTVQPRGTISNIPYAKAVYHNYLDTQVLTLGFTYRFGKTFKTPGRRNTDSAEEEQNRIKN